MSVTEFESHVRNVGFEDYWHAETSQPIAVVKKIQILCMTNSAVNTGNNICSSLGLLSQYADPLYDGSFQFPVVSAQNL